MLEVEQKRVVTKEGYVLTQLYMLHLFVACGLERIGNLTLLPGGKQDIASNAHDQYRMFSQRLESLNEIVGNLVVALLGCWRSMGEGRVH